MPNIQSAVGGGIVSPSGCLTITAIQQNIPDDTPTLVNFDSIVTGFTDGIEDVDAKKITPAVAGLYIVTAAITYNTKVDAKPFELRLKKSGAEVKKDSKISADLNYLTCSISLPLWLTAANYLQVYAWQWTGLSTIDIIAGLQYSHFAVQRVR